MKWKDSLVAYHLAATRNPHEEMATRNVVLCEVKVALVLPHDYNNEHPTGYFKYYVYGRKGVVDSRGRVVIPAIYEEINQLDTFLFEAKFNSYEGPWRLIEVTK